MSVLYPVASWGSTARTVFSMSRHGPFGGWHSQGPGYATDCSRWWPGDDSGYYGDDSGDATTTGASSAGTLVISNARTAASPTSEEQEVVLHCGSQGHILHEAVGGCVVCQESVSDRRLFCDHCAGILHPKCAWQCVACHDWYCPPHVDPRAHRCIDNFNEEAQQQRSMMPVTAEASELGEVPVDAPGDPGVGTAMATTAGAYIVRPATAQPSWILTPSPRPIYPQPSTAVNISRGSDRYRPGYTIAPPGFTIAPPGVHPRTTALLMARVEHARLAVEDDRLASNDWSQHRSRSNRSRSLRR
jgi:hypothetical protein